MWVYFRRVTKIDLRRQLVTPTDVRTPELAVDADQRGTLTGGGVIGLDVEMKFGLCTLLIS